MKGGANDCVLRVQSQNASGSWTPPIAPLAVSMASMVTYDHDRVYERGTVVNGVEGGSGWVKVYFVPNGRGVSTALFKLHIEGVMASLPVRLLFSSCEELPRRGLPRRGLLKWPCVPRGTLGHPRVIFFWALFFISIAAGFPFPT